MSVFGFSFAAVIVEERVAAIAVIGGVACPDNDGEISGGF